MWAFERTAESTATPDAVWAIYADVRTWPVWDRGVERVELNGPLAAGARGWITPVGRGRIPLIVTSADPGRGFVAESHVMGHIMRVRRTIEVRPGGVRITHRVEVEGPAAFDFGPNVVDNVPQALAALAALAEEPGRSR